MNKDIDPSSSVETTIDLPIQPGLAYLKPFYVVGRRIVSEANLRAAPSNGAAQDLIESNISRLRDAVAAYFAVSPPVEKWRREPSIEAERDFAHGDLIIQFSARGFFDQLVAFEDAQCLVTELP